MTRVVLDTSVVASGLFWKGFPQVLVAAAAAEQIQVVTSEPLLHELWVVLRRRKFSAKVAATGRTVEELVERYTQLARIVHPVAIRPTAADPDDDIVLGTALAAHVDLLVSGDTHLLSLGQFEGVPIVNPADAVARCRLS